ncbi:uncharacterized protein [Mytilus edulis]|uniref:uncharacterized protein n=1 Tax=Mytilus edulis TaxID=6550 RepID=UPI0039F12F1D
MEAMVTLSVFLLLIFPVVLTSSRIVGFNKNDCNKKHVLLSQNDTFGVDWTGHQYPKHCTLPFKVQDASLYRLCANVTVFDIECHVVFDELNRAVVFYRGNDRSQQKKYDCHDKLPITFCSGSETLSIELEPYYKDIRQSNSKLKIFVTTSLKATSNDIEENSGEGSILIGVVATCIILIIVLFACLIILIRRRRRYSKDTIDNNIQVRQSEEPQQSQQTEGEPIESRLLSSASNVDSQLRRARQNNPPIDLGINGATGQRNELLSSRSGQTSLSIETHAPPLNDESHFHTPVTSRTNHPRFDDNIERNTEPRYGRRYHGRTPIDPSEPRHGRRNNGRTPIDPSEPRHGRRYNGRTPTDPSATPLDRTHDFYQPMESQPNQITIDQVVDENTDIRHGRRYNGRTPIDPSAPPLDRTHDFYRPMESQPNQITIDQVVDENTDIRHGISCTNRNPTEIIQRNTPQRHDQSTEPSSTHSGSSRNINAIPPPSYLDVMSRSRDFDLR